MAEPDVVGSRSSWPSPASPTSRPEQPTPLPPPLPPGVTVGANGRRYPRAFNHDQARALYGQGISMRRLAVHFGVSDAAVLRVVNPDVRERMSRAANAKIMSGTCDHCGGPTVLDRYRNGDPGDGKLLCKTCRGRERRTRYRLDELGQLAAVHCSACDTWQPPEEFGPSAVAKWLAGERPRSECRTCQTASRTAYRNRRRVPCTRCGKPRTHPDELGNERRKKRDTGLCEDCFKAEYLIGHPGAGIRRREEVEAA